MINSLTSTIIDCPYCGEELEIFIDGSTGSQDYIEDCQVCCSPMDISVEIGSAGQILNIQLKRDSD